MKENKRKKRHCQQIELEGFSNFLCPISLEIMRDPVITCDGHTYDRPHIETWFQRGNRTSPSTGLLLQSTNLTPNICLKNVIEEAQHQSDGMKNKYFKILHDLYLTSESVELSPPQHRSLHQECDGIKRQELIKSLRDTGAMVDDLDSQFTPHELRQAGYTVQELRTSGYGAAPLLRAGFSIQELKDSGVRAHELLDAGKPISDIIKIYERKELQLTAEQLIKAQVPVHQWVDCGIDIKEFCKHFPLQNALGEGYTVRDMRLAGFPLSELRAAGISLEALFSGGYGCEMQAQKQQGVRKLQAKGWTPSELRAIGFRISALRKAGFSYDDIKSAGYPASALAGAGIH